MNKRRLAGYAIITGLLIALDRIFKVLARASCTDPQHIMPGVSCALSLNRGVALGIFNYADNALIFYALTGIIAIITGLLIVYAYKRMQAGLSITGELLIISGALGNLVDRFIYGGVIDFIVLSYGSYTFPVFNGADVFITLGTALLILREIKKNGTAS